MADDKLRALWRAHNANPTPETRDAYRAARARAGLPTLPPHSWENQRKRILNIAEFMARGGDGRVEWAEGYASTADGDAPHGILILSGEGWDLEKLNDRLPYSGKPAMVPARRGIGAWVNGSATGSRASLCGLRRLASRGGSLAFVLGMHGLQGLASLRGRGLPLRRFGGLASDKPLAVCRA